MNKTDFESFPVGTIFNEVSLTATPQLTPEREVLIHYPARLEAMALDPSKVTDNNNLVYTAGQIDFSVALFKHVNVKVLDQSDQIVVTERTKRKALVLHAALIMKSALNFDIGLEIDVTEDISLRHCGLGSSSGLIAATASAINELFGKPITPLDICRYCAQNHGEEIDGDETRLVPVQCLGGSAVCGNYEGGLTILAGEVTPIFTHNLPEALTVVIGVPNDYTHPDSLTLMNQEQKNMEGFAKTGQVYGKAIAYRLVHEVMPGLKRENLKPCKDLIFDYRWDMGSINNCSFVLPRINDIAENLKGLKDDGDIQILSLSSVGPGFFALTNNPKKVEVIFENLNMKVTTAGIYNGKYKVTQISKDER